MSRRNLLTAAVTLAASAAIPVRLWAATLSQFRPNGTGGLNHAAFDALLASYVRTDGSGYNTVNYSAFKAAGLGPLRVYLAELEAAKPSGFSRSEAQAYWINLYNAKTLEVVLTHYPVKSIREINLGGGGIFGRGPWSKNLLAVEGTALSLDDIEHAIIRPIFADPLNHYGLNCASYSCPNLAARAYTSANIAGILNEGAKAYVCHPRGVDVIDGRITASKIYSWYADDFGGRNGLKPHWLRYAKPAHAGEIKPASIGGFDYDWRLNDI